MRENSSRSRFSLSAALLVLVGAIALTARPTAPKSAAVEDGASAQFGGRRSSDEPLEVHQRRAQEPGRGRDATAPWQMPWLGWKDVLWRTYNETWNDRLLYVAAGVAFFVLLAIFPAISALVSCYALIADPSTIIDQISVLKGVIPNGTYDILSTQAHRIIQSGTGSLSFAFVLSLLFALWSANSGMKAILDGLNVVYEQVDRRSFVRLTLISLAMTLGSIALLLLSAAAFIALPLIVSFVGLGSMAAVATTLLRWPLLFFLILGALGVLYRYGPHRATARVSWISIGSIVATFAWLVTSALLSWYLSNFANYDATYGSLGALAGMMMWLWVSFVVVLVGAELNAELEHQTARDSTLPPEKPLGRRGAVMADTVGPAQD